MSAITSPSFQKLVLALKKHKKTLTVVEQACGGLINTSIMAQPGASQVYLGGCIPYNTSKTKGLLLNNTDLHQSLTTAIDAEFDKSTSSGYINSKCNWTRKTATAFCTELQSDYAISEGGAAGPTFNPVGMKSGFTVISIAGRKRNEDDNGDIVKLLKQDIIKASTNKRQKNMRLFADAAAELLLEILNDEEKQAKKKKEEEELLIKISNYDEKQDKKEKKKKKKEEEELPITLDRCTVLRSDDKALYYIERIAKYIVVNKTDMLFKKSSDNDGSVPELALISYEDIMNEYYTSTTNNITKTFLGRLSDKSNTPIFSIDILPDDETDYLVDLGRFLHNTDGYYMSNVRTTAPLLNQLHNELALHAMAYSNWQRKNKYCTNCGSSVPLDLIHGSTCQKCSSCQSMYWPRQDPSMIASIISRCGNKILLARSHRHPPKMHTVLAGFVEVGETFESAVARETFEEVGIRIDLDSIKYIGSQPWPFPQSCMIAFTAIADENQELTIDTNELIDAKWFSRQDVENAASKIQDSVNVMSSEQAKIVLDANPSLPLLIPPKRVIARTLIDEWLYNK